MSKFQLKPKELVEKQDQPERWNFAPVENDIKILAFSGKLGSGKSSSSNFLHSLAFMYVLGLTDHAFVNEDGKLVVKTAEGDYNDVNLNSKHPEVVDFLSRSVWPFIKNYSCADYLKRICIDVLGLDENLVYGSQADKQTLTHLNWEDVPTFEKEVAPKNSKSKIGIRVKTGKMTVRDVLEYVGTELFRKMHNNCWAEALVKSIKRDKSSFAIVDDVRFINEVEAVQKAGGKVIRLTLVTDEAAANTHASNIELDNYDGFDYVLDNSSKSMEDTFRELLSVLTDWGYFAVVQ